jgi:hypothetical protein
MQKRFCHSEPEGNGKSASAEEAAFVATVISKIEEAGRKSDQNADNAEGI